MFNAIIYVPQEATVRPIIVDIIYSCRRTSVAAPSSAVVDCCC